MKIDGLLYQFVVVFYKYKKLNLLLNTFIARSSARILCCQEVDVLIVYDA